MAFLTDEALDQGLDYLDTNGTRLDICSTEPNTYLQATSTLSLGNDTVNVTASTAGDTSGRKVTIPAITSGSVTGTGTAGFWALTNGSDTLLATNSLAASQAVTSGNTFSLTAIDIEFAAAVSE